MRGPRIRPQGQSTWHHIFNHAVGSSEDRPLGPVECEEFLSMMLTQEKLFTVKVVSFIVMGNHFHIVLYDPGELVSEEEACQRYNDFYPDRAPLQPGTARCAEFREYIGNMSQYMCRLEGMFSTWYNKKQIPQRKGAFWVRRFTNSILLDGLSVLNGLLYVENNAVRAGAAARVDQYEHSSLSTWLRTGDHPCIETIEKVLLPLMRDVLRIETSEELLQGIAAQLRAREASEAGGQEARHFHRRERGWTWGGVIGPKELVREFMHRECGIDPETAHEMLSLEIDKTQKLSLWRRFRQILT
jgi:putative transposase